MTRILRGYMKQNEITKISAREEAKKKSRNGFMHVDWLGPQSTLARLGSTLILKPGMFTHT